MTVTSKDGGEQILGGRREKRVRDGEMKQTGHKEVTVTEKGTVSRIRMKRQVR